MLTAYGGLCSIAVCGDGKRNTPIAPITRTWKYTHLILNLQRASRGLGPYCQSVQRRADHDPGGRKINQCRARRRVVRSERLAVQSLRVDCGLIE